jgi:intracellular septation protein
MKLLLDFLPLILFFGTYKYAQAHKDWAASFATDQLGFMVAGGAVGSEEAPVLLATVVVIVATLVQVAYLKATRRKVDLMLWVSLVLVVVMGGATIWFHDAMFIKWKPSIMFWFMGIAFWISQTVFHKNLPRLMMGEHVELPDTVWHRLNFIWIAFVALMGLLNVWFAYGFSTDAWASFHTWGSFILMGVFVVGQTLYISPYLKDEPSAAQVQPVKAESSAERQRP